MTVPAHLRNDEHPLDLECRSERPEGSARDGPARDRADGEDAAVPFERRDVDPVHRLPGIAPLDLFVELRDQRSRRGRSRGDDRDHERRVRRVVCGRPIRFAMVAVVHKDARARGLTRRTQRV